MSSRHIRIVTGAWLLAIVAGCGGRASGPETGDAPTRSVGSILTAEEIDRSNRTFNSVQELLLVMPGIVASGRGGVQIVGLGGTPLYVVNGVPMSDVSGALSLNPRDVERIEILRSGGATAQYGFRGANGVILITTKH